MMFGFLAPLAIAGAKFVGKRALHLGGAHLGILGKAASTFAGAPSLIEKVVFDLGGRYFLGFGTALYLNNAEFRHGANICLNAIRHALASSIGKLF